MTRQEWTNKFASVPPQLTLRQLSQRIGQTYRITATWARKLNYPKASGHDLLWTAQRRRQFQRIPWHEVNWGLTNVQIARIYDVSREIVRRRRKEFLKNHGNS